MKPLMGLDGFVIRTPAVGDAQGVADLVAAYDTWAFGSADYTVADLREEWSELEFVLETDAVIVSTPAGQVAGFGAVRDRGAHTRLVGDGYVHPAYHGRGVGTFLLRWIEWRAQGIVEAAHAGMRVTLDSLTAGTDTAAATLFTREGYSRVRTFWHMAIRLEEPPTPRWPTGLVVRAFIPAQDEQAAYTAAQEAFRDHWGHVPISFEEWRASRIERADFDPALTFLARQGDQIAGAIRARPRGAGDPRTGWVDNLAVRRPWRGQGLGLALLLHTFAAFHRRGIHEVALSVDAESITGATRLYERAGMHVERSFAMYRTVLRDGAESPAGTEDDS